MTDESAVRRVDSTRVAGSVEVLQKRYDDPPRAVEGLSRLAHRERLRQSGEEFDGLVGGLGQQVDIAADGHEATSLHHFPAHSAVQAKRVELTKLGSAEGVLA